MSTHNDIGHLGEQIARDYLIARGYAVFTGNDRSAGAEIDIIAFSGPFIIFAEVKTRNYHPIDPIEVVGTRKRNRICRAADAFIRANNIRHEPRFDIITVALLPGSRPPVISHYPDAFFPAISTL